MQTSPKGITLQKAFEDFICEKKVLKLSEATVQAYENRFKDFSKFFPADNLCADVTSTTIFRYIEFLQTRNPDIKATSINANLRHLRAIFYNFMEAGYTKKFTIKMLKCEKELIEVYSEAELEKLLKKPDIKNCSFAEYRDWVMVCYFLGTGNRLSTVCNLAIKDVDFDNHEVSLRKVKNKKPYTIPLSSTLEKTLMEYLKVRKGQPDDYLFCNKYGEQMQRTSMGSVIYRYNHSRGVIKTSIHLFRHTFAKNWILNGGDPFRLQAILGHSTMAMVNEYVNMFGKDLHRDFDTFNPLEKMKGLMGERTAIKVGK